MPSAACSKGNNRRRRPTPEVGPVASAGGMQAAPLIRRRARSPLDR